VPRADEIERALKDGTSEAAGTMQSGANIPNISSASSDG
jgi:hypothetical protein